MMCGATVQQASAMNQSKYGFRTTIRRTCSLSVLASIRRRSRSMISTRNSRLPCDELWRRVLVAVRKWFRNGSGRAGNKVE